MAKEKEEPRLERVTTARTERTVIRLNEVKLLPEKYSHRNANELSTDKLKPLMQSLVLDGLQVPIEIDPQNVILKGHRRVAAMRELARVNTPNFAEDLEVPALRVLDATPEDMLVRSIADSCQRTGLSRTERIRAAKKLFDNGVEVNRAAWALGISPKSYERDLRIARHGWMYQHVEDFSIAPNVAHELLEKAESVERVGELKEDLDAWIAEQKRLIRRRDKQKRAETGKGLKDQDKQVKRFMPKHLVSHWLSLLQEGKRFDDEADWNFFATIDRDKDLLRIPSVSLDLAKSPVDRIGKVAAKLRALTDQLSPYIRKRLEEERTRSGSPESQILYDTRFLAELGLTDLADELEARNQPAAPEEDGEDEPSHDVAEERKETDLVDSIRLPEPAADDDSEDADSDPQDEEASE